MDGNKLNVFILDQGIRQDTQLDSCALSGRTRALNSGYRLGIISLGIANMSHLPVHNQEGMWVSGFNISRLPVIQSSFPPPNKKQTITENLGVFGWLYTFSFSLFMCRQIVYRTIKFWDTTHFFSDGKMLHLKRDMLTSEEWRLDFEL